MSEVRVPGAGIRVVDIADHKTKVNEAAIELLRSALASAQAGEVVEVVMVTFDEGENPTILQTPSLDQTRCIGALELVKQSRLRDWFATADEEEEG